jgi:signal transduction histidine kinase
VWLRVANDSAIAAADHRPGRGLENLAERVRAVGGSLGTRADGDGFVLTACLPADPAARSRT